MRLRLGVAGVPREHERGQRLAAGLAAWTMLHPQHGGSEVDAEATLLAVQARVLGPKGRENQVKFLFQAASPCWVA